MYHDPKPSDDDLDAGICDGPDAPRGEPTADGEETDALVLFADVDFTDPEAVEYRRAGWVNMFAGADDGP